MTDITLTGPDHCAQCGADLDVEGILAESLATGKAYQVTGAYVVIRGHKMAIPGLYWDKACGVAIESGAIESTLTLEAANAFLDDVWGPMVVGAGLKATFAGDDQLAEEAARRLADVLEVSLVLETVLEAVKDGDDLSWLPEYDGKCGEHEPHPAEVAHLN